jgi:hypothetical protein
MLGEASMIGAFWTYGWVVRRTVASPEQDEWVVHRTRTGLGRVVHRTRAAGKFSCYYYFPA